MWNWFIVVAFGGAQRSARPAFKALTDLGGYGLRATLLLLLSLTPCLSAVSAERAGLSTASAVSARASGPEVRSEYTLDQVLQGIRSRDAKYRAVPLRIEYSHTVNNTQDQPPQKTDCTLLIHGKNFRNEVRDAKGRKGWEYRINGVRAEVGRRWQRFDTLLPLNDADSQELGDRIFYHAHNHGFNTGRMVALIVDGIESWREAYFREVMRAGNLRITKTEVNGIPCVQVSAGGHVLCLAPQYDWGIVRSYDLMTRGFRSFDGRFFPMVLERTLHSHDLQGGFFTFREACEIRSVSQAEDPGPDFWNIPEPKPGTWVKVAYPRWDTKWEDELGPPVTPQIVRDSVRAEHAFTWPPSGKDARIYETSRHWRDAAELDLVLSSEVPLPFMSVDGKQIVWATYEPTRQRLSMFDPARQKDAAEGRGVKLEAGFLPERSEIRLGEAVDVTFYITNTGTQPFYLATGGDSQGARSDRFQFWAVDLEGTPAPDPNPRPGHFGRKQCLPAKVAPGGGYSEKLHLSCWVKFEQPGEYLVRGWHLIQLLGKQESSTNYVLVHPLLADFKLTVRTQDPNQPAAKSQSH